MPSLLVIGGASLDVLRFAGRVERSAGGAGLYTALAAHRAGARVTMFAPRPEPMPAELAPASERLIWIGPSVLPEELPTFDIAHYGGGRAELVDARWGAEAMIAVGNLPASIAADTPAIAYVGPLAEPERMLAFVRHLKSTGLRVAAGTYGRIAHRATETVRAVLREADIFFCNENEAGPLFGGVDSARAEPGRLLFVTRSAEGACVFQGEHRTDIPGLPATEHDPTGAGDTFCGTTMALLAQGWHPVMAARRACAAAAEMIAEVGPSALLRPGSPLDYPADPRVRVDREQVARVAGLIAGLPEVEPFPFTGEFFPPEGHPGALDFFFAATLQQFGFWEDDGVAYRRPMVATLAGQSLKGSDYLWAAYRRWLDVDPAGLAPDAQAALAEETLAARFRADDGTNPMPAFALHLEEARHYGSDMLALGWTAREVVARANESKRPLAAFLSLLDHAGGYKEDPLRKKATLLAIILQQRPERFLRADPDEPVPPIIDYHLQRSCLRIGLVDVADPDLRGRIVGRRVLPPGDEWAVRLACFDAIERVQRLSGKSMGAVDWFFFGARRRCPEMAEPDCPSCPVDPVCAHRKELFQPVVRTTNY